MTTRPLIKTTLPRATAPDRSITVYVLTGFTVTADGLTITTTELTPRKETELPLYTPLIATECITTARGSYLNVALYQAGRTHLGGLRLMRLALAECHNRIETGVWSFLDLAAACLVGNAPVPRA
ncbi:hypothetical protein [Embleya sp. MST-111070]|uniref:hypothetical protein n=1 Tax=Embleya sp. MST-111070 TaxID=3398231 RepID=UPI003F736A2D